MLHEGWVASDVKRFIPRCRSARFTPQNETTCWLTAGN